MSYNYSRFTLLKKSLEQINEDFEGWLIDFLLRNANEGIRMLKGKTPVQTGYLRRSWRLSNWYEKEDGTLEVWFINTANYASYVEVGHMSADRKKWVPGRFFMKTTLSELEENIPRRFEKDFRVFLARRGVK